MSLEGRTRTCRMYLPLIPAPEIKHRNPIASAFSKLRRSRLTPPSALPAFSSCSMCHPTEQNRFEAKRELQTHEMVGLTLHLLRARVLKLAAQVPTSSVTRQSPPSLSDQARKLVALSCEQSPSKPFMQH